MSEHESYQVNYRHPHFTWSEHAKELIRDPKPPKEAHYTDASGQYDEQAHQEALQRHNDAVEGLTGEDGLSWAEVQALQHTAEVIVEEAHNENRAINEMSEAERTKYLAEMREHNDLTTLNRSREQIMAEQTVLGLSETTKKIAEKGEEVAIEKALTSEAIAKALNTGEIPPVVFMSRQKDGDTRMAIIDGKVPVMFRNEKGETSPLFEARSHSQDGTKVRVYLHPRYNTTESNSGNFTLNVLTFPAMGTDGPNFSKNVAALKEAMDNRDKRANS